MTLTIAWLLPLVGAVLIAGLPPHLAKYMAVIVSLGTLFVTGVVAVLFAPDYHRFQFAEVAPWIPQLHVFYRLGVDGISVWLLVLNALLTVVAVLATPLAMRNVSRFLALMLAMSAGMSGVVMATDLVLFYVFWEAMLIPAYFLLWLFGEGERPGRAALKFVLFTLVGSLLMLVGVIGEYVFQNAGPGQQTFDLARLPELAPQPSVQFGLFFLFALAFAIKTPMFPFHTWLPDAYAAAPTPMLVTFAGFMGKTGAFGFLRIAIPLFPDPSGWWDWRWVVPALAVAGIVWGAMMAIAQLDMKMLIAYSSISHMGFIVLGIFSFNVQGQQGAVLQMVNHGIIIPALFLLAAWIADRTGTWDRSGITGLAPRMPILAGVFTIVALAALGLPGLNSFVGEFMTLLGAWQRAPALAIAGAIGLVLAPVYILRFFQGAMYAEKPYPNQVDDIHAGQLTLLAPLVLLMFAIGLAPGVLTTFMTSIVQPGLAR
jgi:NADH-quinone oxidoreductase subunit M